MLCIWKIVDVLWILTEEEGKDFLFKKFCECFESTKEDSCSELDEETNVIKFTELLHIFLTTPDKADKYIESVDKPEAKIIMQSSSFINWICIYNTDALNTFD